MVPRARMQRAARFGRKTNKAESAGRSGGTKFQGCIRLIEARRVVSALTRQLTSQAQRDDVSHSKLGAA